MAAPMHEQKRDLFQRHFLLGKLEPGEIDTLAMRARVESYRAGQEIYAKGSPGRTMIAVLQGSVKIVSLSPTGKEVVLNVIHAGEVFGEIAVIDGEERSAGAAAMTDCELLIIDRRDVLPMFERHLEIWMTLTQILCRRLRRTSEQVEDVLFRSLEARLAKALLQLMEDAKRAESRDPEVVLHLSQNDLAMIAGGSRESVNKLLHAWTGGVDRAGPGLDRDPRCGGPRAVGLTMFDQTARQLPELSTIPWMDPSFTGDTRPRGALQNS